MPAPWSIDYGLSGCHTEYGSFDITNNRGNLMPNPNPTWFRVNVNFNVNPPECADSPPEDTTAWVDPGDHWLCAISGVGYVNFCGFEPGGREFESLRARSNSDFVQQLPTCVNCLLFRPVVPSAAATRVDEGFCGRCERSQRASVTAQNTGRPTTGSRPAGTEATRHPPVRPGSSC